MKCVWHVMEDVHMQLRSLFGSTQIDKALKLSAEQRNRFVNSESDTFPSSRYD